MKAKPPTGDSTVRPRNIGRATLFSTQRTDIPMRAVIKSLHTPHAPSLFDFAPEDEFDFALLIQVMAGPDEGEGEESFDVEVVTPAHLSQRLSRSGPMSGRHLLLVERFDPAAIQRWLERAVAASTGGDWRAVADKLSRIGRWEFEDYVE